MGILNNKVLTQNKNAGAVLLLMLTACYCTAPLFIYQNLPMAHDTVFHLFMADQFNRSVTEGVYFPRWVPDANNGYGCPSFLFYAPLSYYFVSALRILLPSLIMSMITAVWCSFFLSGLAMYLSTGRIFGGAGSLPAAIIYQILPFHLIDLYTRGTFAELFAFAWFPVIILFLYRTLGSKSRLAFTGLSISYAGLILTHLVSGFICSIVIALFIIFNLFRMEKRGSFRVLFSVLLGLGLSAYYLVPAILERRFVQIEYVVNCTVCDYRNNFLFIWSDIQPALEYFYLNLHIGVVLECLLFLFITILIFRNRKLLSYGSPQNSFIFLFLSAFFITTPLSLPLWDFIPFMPFLQFPWRWVILMEVALCFLIAAFFRTETMSSFRTNLLERIVIYLLVTLFTVSSVSLIKSKPLPESFTANVVNPERIKDVMDPAIEYTPIWARNMKQIMSEEKPVKINVMSGPALTDILEWKPEKRSISIAGSAPSLLRVATFYYPGWQAKINDRIIPIGKEDMSGAMLIQVPEGKQTLELRFLDTPTRRYSGAVSLFSCLILVLLASLRAIRRTARHDSINRKNGCLKGV